MDEYDYGENEDYENENIFQDEVLAYQRAGPIGKLQELLSKTTNLEPNKKEITSQEDRYLLNISSISRNINLDQKEMDSILTLTQKMKNTKYKNAGATVLGFIILNKYKNTDDIINNSLLKKIFVEEKYKSILSQFGVEKEDVIRYSRYLSNLI
jgi:hypothetical protein